MNKFTTVAIPFLRIRLLTREYYGLLADTFKLDQTIARYLMISIGFNVVIFAFDAFLPLIHKYMVDTVAGEEKVEGLFSALALVMLYWLLRTTKDVVIEALREWFNESYLRPLLYTELSRRGKRAIMSLSLLKRKEAQPVLLRGRESWMILVEFPIREVPVIILALPAFLMLANHGWDLYFLAVTGVVMSIGITMLKDHFITPLFDQRQDNEIRFLDTEQKLCLQGNVSEGEYEEALGAYVSANKKAKVRETYWDNGFRDGWFMLVILVGLLMTVIGSAAEGMTAGELTFIITLLDQGRRPAAAVFNMQKEMQFRREAIKRFKEISGK